MRRHEVKITLSPYLYGGGLRGKGKDKEREREKEGRAEEGGVIEGRGREGMSVTACHLEQYSV